jgi:hypothetical protein
MIVAYGVNEVPLVYTNWMPVIFPANTTMTAASSWFSIQAGEPVPTFSNVAYIYVEETSRAGLRAR